MPARRHQALPTAHYMLGAVYLGDLGEGARPAAIPDVGRHRDHRRDGAAAMLGEVYAWFTEGHDTADLRAARQVLDQLG